ncbi:MAG: phenylalanine--tRNA ligase subunit beta [Bacteroidetes bacterium]|nr:phenylalanine--tRNA ligase subunit beta [Bacteroidota bacterium]
MNISLNWLQQYINIDEENKIISEILTDIGLEVGHVEPFSFFNEDLVIAKVITCEQHPNAERLKKTTVDIGNDKLLNVICGAPNVAAGQKVVFAPVGTILTFKNGDTLKLKKVKIRGEISEGMICAEDEIGISDNHDTIIELNTNLDPGTPISKYYKTEKDSIFDIELTPNRTDAFSHIGVARDLAARLNKDFKYPEIKDLPKLNSNEKLDINIKIEDPKLCSRYAGIVIKDVKIQDSPIWLKNRLKSIGLNPVNNIVDITNFVLHEWGQPLHAFDYDKIVDKEIVIKTSKKEINFETLDDKERKLTGKELMIYDSQNPLCIAGIMGGKDSSVTELTKNIFLECAYFDPILISKTSKKLNINTDSSYRFERGTDPNKIIYVLKRAISLIIKETKGQIASDIIDIYPNKIKNHQVEIYFENINNLIGSEIPKSDIKRILKNLEIEILNETEQKILLSIPTYRVDVTREADVIEEILRIYGYNKIEFNEFLNTDYIAGRNEIMDIYSKKQEISDTLISKGFNEIMTNSLTNSNYSNLLDIKNHERIDILNPLSEITNSLRQTLLFSGLEVISNNIHRGNKNLSFFEFGKIYYKQHNKYHEKNKLSLWITKNKENLSWIKDSEESLFQNLNSSVYSIFEKLGINKFNKINKNINLYNKSITFVYDDKEILNIGYISSKILNNFNIKQDLVFADIDWDLLSNIKLSEIEYQEVSKFPEVRRDLSLILNKDKSYEDVKNIIEKFPEKKLIDYNLVDIFEGEKIGTNKKTLTINFILQDKRNTLKDKEIDKIVNKLMNTFEKGLEAEIKRS